MKPFIKQGMNVAMNETLISLWFGKCCANIDFSFKYIRSLHGSAI